MPLKRPLTAMLAVAGFAAFGCGSGSDPDPDPASAAKPSEQQIYVSPHGRAGAAGSRAAPVKTVAEAVKRATAERVVLLDGPYPAEQITARPGRRVTVTAERPGRVSVAGLHLAGAANLAFANIRFTGAVMVTRRPPPGPGSSGISFRGSEFTGGGRGVCLMIRSGARSIAVRGSRIHDCGTGIGGPGGTERSSRIAITGNRLQRFKGDAIAFGHWSDVVIARNTIKGMRDPDRVIHNDGIQFFGDSQRVRISRNRIEDSAGQLILIQPAVGPIDDVLIDSNVIAGADAYAIQQQGGRRVRFLGNTIWRNGFGGLIVRGGQTGPARDTVVVDNIIDRYLQGEGATSRRSHNLLGTRATPRARAERNAKAPGFVAANRGRFDLRCGSPAIDAGVRTRELVVDLRGVKRAKRPDLGALERRAKC